MGSRVKLLAGAGQAVWLDYLHRRILESGELARLIENDGVSGLTSNPSIFEQAIGGGADYDEALAAAMKGGDDEVMALYERLAIADIQGAADAFRGLYDRADGRDGYVSLEVSPYLAMDTEATIAEARRLWRTVDRPNLMIKVPGTKPGVPAIRALIGEGINVNVTLLFALDAYLAVSEAHIAGLEAFKASGGETSRVHGVASFFVSRIDAEIDKKIDALIKNGGGDDAEALRSLRGKVAVANAKIAYQHWLEMIETPRWQALAKAGAAPQRLLWASTGTKDPAYSDVFYPEALIGPETVDTVPPKTLDAFRDHGVVAETLTEDVDGGAAQKGILSEAERLQLDLDGVTAALVENGVAKFAEAFDGLLAAAVASKRAKILGKAQNGQAICLPRALAEDVDAALDHATREGWPRRLWTGDASLWTGGDEGKWLGWLGAGSGGAVSVSELEALTARVGAADYGHAVLLGMGGSRSRARGAGDRVRTVKWAPAAVGAGFHRPRPDRQGPRRRSTPPTPCLSSPASRARPWSRTSSIATSSRRRRRRSARARPVRASLRSLIPVRTWKKPPTRMASPRCCLVIRPSAGAIR